MCILHTSIYIQTFCSVKIMNKLRISTVHNNTKFFCESYCFKSFVLNIQDRKTIYRKHKIQKGEES